VSKPTAMQKVQLRGLSVTEREVQEFPFDHCDVLLAEALMAGCSTAADISRETEVQQSLVRERLTDPVRCAWLSRELAKAVEHRLGNVLAAVYARCMRNGDPNAAKLLLNRFGQLMERKQVQHQHLHLDYTALSNEELEKVIADNERRLGRSTDAGTDS
jgi:hypothetical protein